MGGSRKAVASAIRSCALGWQGAAIRGQHALNPVFLVGRALNQGRVGQIGMAARVGLVKAHKVGAQQFHRLGVVPAQRGDRCEVRLAPMNAKAFQQGVGADGVECRKRHQTSMGTVEERGKSEPGGQDHDAGQRFRSQLFEEPAQLGVQ